MAVNVTLVAEERNSTNTPSEIINPCRFVLIFINRNVILGRQ